MIIYIVGAIAVVIVIGCFILANKAIEKAKISKDKDPEFKL